MALRPAVACRDPFEAAWERVLKCVLALARVCVRRASERGERREMERKASHWLGGTAYGPSAHRQGCPAIDSGLPYGGIYLTRRALR